MSAAPFAVWPRKLGISIGSLRQWLEQLEQEGYLQDESLNGRMAVKVYGGRG